MKSLLRSLTIQTGLMYAAKRVRLASTLPLADVGQVDHLLKEVEIMTSLDHPHIAKVYEYFVDERFTKVKESKQQPFQFCVDYFGALFRR